MGLELVVGVMALGTANDPGAVRVRAATNTTYFYNSLQLLRVNGWNL